MDKIANSANLLINKGLFLYSGRLKLLLLTLELDLHLQLFRRILLVLLQLTNLLLDLVDIGTLTIDSVTGYPILLA